MYTWQDYPTKVREGNILKVSSRLKEKIYSVLMKCLMDNLGMKRQILEYVLEGETRTKEGLNEYL